MYSQYGEDDIFLPLLANIECGACLDIGAWSATTFSNSRALIERGWRALLIEPSPGPVKELARAYAADCPRVQVLAAAVSVEGHTIDLEITDDAVSQPSGDRAEVWRDVGGFYGHLLVPGISIANLFAQHGGDFDFASIDTEGTSVDLFAEMLRVGPRPAIVMVEHDNRIVELAQYAEQAGYRQVHLNGTNWIGQWNGRQR